MECESELRIRIKTLKASMAKQAWKRGVRA